MEDLTDALKPRNRSVHERNTEPPEIVTNNAKKIVDFLAKKKGVENGRLEVNVLCVLGAGWDEVWEDALKECSRPGLKVIPRIRVFDYNENQIEAFGAGKDVIRMRLGDDAGNDQLAQLLEEGVDLFIPSNLGDWIGAEEVINLAEVIEESPPSVIVLAGKEPFTEYGQMVDELEDLYAFDQFESDEMKYEIRYQAIGYLQDEEGDD